MLSEFTEKIESNVMKRCIQKISEAGTDPVLIHHRSLKAGSHDPIFGANYFSNSKNLVT